MNEVFSVCDFISINEYLDPLDPNSEVHSATWSMFDDCVIDCRNADVPLVITEFGRVSGDDEVQRVWYEQ